MHSTPETQPVCRPAVSQAPQTVHRTRATPLKAVTASTAAPQATFADVRRVAGQCAMQATLATFRVGVMVPDAIDRLAGEAVGDMSRLVAIGPGIAGGIAGGLLALPLGGRFHRGVNFGTSVGMHLTQLVVEGSYRLMIINMIGAAMGTSLAVGAGAGALALVGCSAQHVCQRACTAAAPHFDESSIWPAPVPVQ